MHQYMKQSFKIHEKRNRKAKKEQIEKSRSIVSIIDRTNRNPIRT